MPPQAETSSEQHPLEESLIEHYAQQARDVAQSATSGRADRFRQLAADYAHLGGAAEALLALALHDIAVTPVYFEAVTRHGLERALIKPITPQSGEIIQEPTHDNMEHTEHEQAE